MKKYSLTFLTVLAMSFLANPSYAQTGGKKTLIAYYSWSGNTETVARQIQSLTGADVFVIEPVEAYPTDYNECVDQAKAEIEAGVKRPIKGVPDIASYDVVFVGTPNWWSTMAPPVLTFLSGQDLSGKTIAPFVTHGGGREARCFSDMEKAVPQATFLKGFFVSGTRAGGAQSDVEKWLREIGLLR